MVLVNKVVLNPKVTIGKIGQIEYFGYSVFPLNATNQNITVTSSNPSVIEVFENSLRFKKTGAATITVTSDDGGFRETFSCFCEANHDFISTVQELELRLQQYYDVLKSDMSKHKNSALVEISNTKVKLIEDLELVCIKLITDVKKITGNNISELNRELQECIEALELTRDDGINSIKALSTAEFKKIDDKLNSVSLNVSKTLASIEKFLSDKEHDFNLYIETTIADAKNSINSLVVNAVNDVTTKLQNVLFSIDKRETIAISNMDEKYSRAITLIESAEITAIEDIRLEVQKLKAELSQEVDGIEGIIKGELNKAITEIKALQDKSLSEITKLELVVKNTVAVELENAVTRIANEVDSVKMIMREYMLELNNEMTVHKDSLMGDIIADKDAILMEFEREANRLIELIREKEYELFQDLQEVQQAIINRIQLVVQGYDAQMEQLKLAKINELELVIQGYDVMIENAKTLAANSITEMGDSYLADLLKAKNDYSTILTNLKDNFSTQLTNEKNTHSTNLTNEYNTHKTSLDNQVKNPTTGLQKILNNDYDRHSAALLSEKNTYTQNLTDTKNSGVSEITNLKNSAMDEIGRNTNSGLWKTVRDSVISTGNEQKTGLTNEGNRLLGLFSDIESAFISLRDEAVARIGTSDSTGLRGEAVSSITTHRANAEKRLGSTDTSMDGSSPSLRKEIIDRLVQLSSQKEQEIRDTGATVKNEAFQQMNAEKDTVNASIMASVSAGEEQMDVAMRNIIATKETNEGAMNALHVSTTTDIENKRVAAVNSVESTKNSAVSTVNSTKDSAVQRIGTSDTSMDGSNSSVRKAAVDAVNSKKNESLTAINNAKGDALTEITNLTTITPAEVDAIWSGL